jgi:hypothetical protein
MLFSSIIKILDQTQPNADTVEPLRTKSSEMAELPESGGAESKSTLETIENEIAAEFGLARPLNAINLPATRQPASPFFEELLRAIKSLQEADKSKVIDIFK